MIPLTPVQRSAVNNRSKLILTAICAIALFPLNETSLAVGTSVEKAPSRVIRVFLDVQVSGSGDLDNARDYLKTALAEIADVRLVEENPNCSLSVIVQGETAFDPPAVALSSVGSVVWKEKVAVQDANLDVAVGLTPYLMPQHFVLLGGAGSLEQGCQQVVQTFEQSTLVPYRTMLSGSIVKLMESQQGPDTRPIGESESAK